MTHYQFLFLVSFLVFFFSFSLGQNTNSENDTPLLEDYDSQPDLSFINNELGIQSEVQNFNVDPTTIEFSEQYKIVPETLAFLTPWHKKAYNYRVPFQYLAPVWFRLTPEKTKSITIVGEHDVNKEWIQEMKQLGKSTKHKIRIVPRFTLEKFNDSDNYKDLFITERDRVLKQITRVIEKYDLDGVTLELGFLQYGAFSHLITSFLAALRKSLTQLAKKNGKTQYYVILVVPSNDALINADTMAKFSKWVDRFFIMTYDYSVNQSHSPGPVSPIQWVENIIKSICVDKKQISCSKLFIGLNFYGYDYTTQGFNPIIGETIENILAENHIREREDHVAQEKIFEYTDSNYVQHTIYYPTDETITKRILLAKRYGTGLGIWEIGQGRESFFEKFTEPRK